jgi:hypothetical protein
LAEQASKDNAAKEAAGALAEVVRAAKETKAANNKTRARQKLKEKKARAKTKRRTHSKAAKVKATTARALGQQTSRATAAIYTAKRPSEEYEADLDEAPQPTPTRSRTAISLLSRLGELGEGAPHSPAIVPAHTSTKSNKTMSRLGAKVGAIFPRHYQDKCGAAYCWFTDRDVVLPAPMARSMVCSATPSCSCPLAPPAPARP